MFYIAHEHIHRAILMLHASGAHDFFRIFLVLKMLGLEYQGTKPVVIDTTIANTVAAELFSVKGLAQPHPTNYDPLTNKLLAWDTGRGTIQTNLVKMRDNSAKAKPDWLDIRRVSNGDEIRFSATYPMILGRTLNGFAASDTAQITIDTPSFVLWMHRYGEWASKPTFDDLWEIVREKLHLSEIEIDLLFDNEREFTSDPFTETLQDESLLAKWIVTEAGRGSSVQVLTTPVRAPFSDTKVKRMVAGYKRTLQMVDWLSVDDIEAESVEILGQTKALLLVGPPGTGKTRLARNIAGKLVEGDNARIHVLQFHASYAYENFIEALVPEPDGGGMRFRPQQKAFALYCEMARLTPQVVILDELNRADVSKVFGEAFLLIEADYRGEEFAVPRLYAQDEKFWIPENLFIVATMNNLDKSTYDLDFAFRRRFGEVFVGPDVEALEQIVRNSGADDEDFLRIIRSAFNDIQTIYPLGHAYFRFVKDRETLRAAYRRVIRPTISDYLGQYRTSDLEKVDSIIKRVLDSTTWEIYTGVKDPE